MPFLPFSFLRYLAFREDLRELCKEHGVDLVANEFNGDGDIFVVEAGEFEGNVADALTNRLED